MTITEFQRAYRATPFQPFTLCLADGQRIAVEHSEFVAMSPRGRTVSVYQTDGTHDVVDLMLVTSLKVRPREEPASKSG